MQCTHTSCASRTRACAPPSFLPAPQCVWYYPNEVFVDKELLAKTRYTKSDADFGKAAHISLFAGSRCLIRRGDGVLVGAATSPYPAMVYDMVRKQQWDKAVRLCRFIKDPTMWATLAAMAMATKELHTAETAFAAIDEVDKAHYVRKVRKLLACACACSALASMQERRFCGHMVLGLLQPCSNKAAFRRTGCVHLPARAQVKAIPTEEGRNAMLAMYQRKPDEAEKILLQVWAVGCGVLV